jgi:hypothetical protein
VRSRTLRGMIRDSRVGSILIAKWIALALGIVVQVLAWPVERIFARVLNFMIVRGFPSAISPFVELESKWSYLLLTQGLLLLVSAFWLGVAYLFAAWVYKPSPRRG